MRAKAWIGSGVSINAVVARSELRSGGAAEHQAGQDADGDIVEDDAEAEAEQKDRAAGERLVHGAENKAGTSSIKPHGDR